MNTGALTLLALFLPGMVALLTGMIVLDSSANRSRRVARCFFALSASIWLGSVFAAVLLISGHGYGAWAYVGCAAVWIVTSITALLVDFMIDAMMMSDIG